MRVFMISAAAALALVGPTVPIAARQGAASGSPQTVAQSLLAADRSFAKAAPKRSAQDAISAMIVDDVVMFIVPQPPLARGKAEAVSVLGEAFAGKPSTLSWTPVGFGISSDGQQGFTYGFTTRSIEVEASQDGKYLAYWVKRPEGWRVAAYKLVPRPAGDVSTELRPILPERIVPAAKQGAEKYRAEVDSVERAFSDESQVTGLGAAFRKYGTAEAMNVGGSADFTYGNDAIAAGFGDEKTSPLRWAPDGVLVASSGDLGITYGYLQRNGDVPKGRLAKIPWFTVWRRAAPGQPWRYIAE